MLTSKLYKFCDGELVKYILSTGLLEFEFPSINSDCCVKNVCNGKTIFQFKLKKIWLRRKDKKCLGAMWIIIEGKKNRENPTNIYK